MRALFILLAAVVLAGCYPARHVVVRSAPVVYYYDYWDYYPWHWYRYDYPVVIHYREPVYVAPARPNRPVVKEPIRQPPPRREVRPPQPQNKAPQNPVLRRRRPDNNGTAKNRNRR